MSIIQEALKKAQSYTAYKFPSKPPIETPHIPEAGIQNPPEPKISDAGPKSSSRPNIFLLAAFLLALGIFLKFSLHTAGMALPAKPVQYEAASLQEVTYKAIADKKDTGIASLELSTKNFLAAATASEAPKLALNGIMYLSGRPQAVINDSVVEEGDTVSGAKVVSITNNAVLLNFNSLEITLTLKK